MNTIYRHAISAALIFYILTIAGIFRLRTTRPQAERPYRAFGYPIVPALYIAGAATILLVLFAYRPATTFNWPFATTDRSRLSVKIQQSPAFFRCRLQSSNRRHRAITRPPIFL